MPRRVVSIALGTLLAAIGALASGRVGFAVQGPAVSFAKDVAPVLERNCLSCHGEAIQMGRFDLRTRDAALRGGTRGADIVPGDAAASRMYRRIAGLEQPAMPAQNPPLPPEQVAAIKQWIDDGAAWVKDDVDGRCQLVKVLSNGFAHAALDAIAIVGLAHDLADG